MQRLRCALAATVTTVTVLAGCGGTIDDTYVVENDPGTVEYVDGDEVPRVGVADAAIARLGFETTTVRAVEGGLMVPSAATFVDPHGQWWVYTTAERGVYQRAPIEILSEDDVQVVYESGPVAGTTVVTVGVAELAGIEEDSGH